MKLNKMKIARLTDDQARKINGGGTGASTHNNFTCCWCSAGDDTFNERCNTKNNGQNTCYHCPTDPTPAPQDPSLVSK